MTIVMRPSCWHQNFGPNGLSAPAQGLCLIFFSSITAADFNISSAVRWAIQDQWSSGFWFHQKVDIIHECFDISQSIYEKIISVQWRVTMEWVKLITLIVIQNDRRFFGSKSHHNKWTRERVANAYLMNTRLFEANNIRFSTLWVKRKYNNLIIMPMLL